ncbi:MAG: hypothetical protein V1644_02835 [Candidatus Micrarchaeota archaeon]
MRELEAEIRRMPHLEIKGIDPTLNSIDVETRHPISINGMQFVARRHGLVPEDMRDAFAVRVNTNKKSREFLGLLVVRSDLIDYNERGFLRFTILGAPNLPHSLRGPFVKFLKALKPKTAK